MFLSSSLLCLQIFFLVVVFALYNGLVFLPVMLSLVGPEPQIEGEEDHPAAEDDEEAAAAAPETRNKNPKIILPEHAKENGDSVELEPLKMNGISENA